MFQTLHSGWLPTHSLHRPIRMQHPVSAYSCTYWFRKSIRKDFSCYCCCSQTPPFLVHTLKVCLTINEILIGSSTHTITSQKNQLQPPPHPTFHFLMNFSWNLFFCHLPVLSLYFLLHGLLKNNKRAPC